MRFNFIKTAMAATLVAGAFVAAPVQTASAGFYKDKVITILIPFGPGGGYHLYSSKLSKHIKQYIPDSPPIVLQFMPGAGGLKGANYFYEVAPKDGTYIALLSQTAALFQRLNKGKKGYRYDASKFQYIGRLVSMDAAHMFYKSLPSRDINTLKGQKAGTVIACTAGKAAQGYINARALAVASGLNIKILTGYQGSRRQNLAMQQGECNYQPGAWNSWKARLGDWIDKKWVKPVALTAPTRHADIPDVPTIVELAKTPELKRIMAFIAGYAAVGRAFSLPPGAPKERVALLRSAFDKTVNNPGFLAEAKKQNMLLGPATGQFVQKVVDDIIGAPDDLVADTRKMLGYK
jgi:tripartite-type tricarboxylate transporter receptor subunit TctC